MVIRDHPRSRGDGYRAGYRLRRTSGSPPLARGRRPAHGPGCRVAGITPARAGTAGCSAHRKAGYRDHPRSRGDGRRSGPDARHIAGSPPLARGRRRRETVLRGHLGITPARAGTAGKLVCPGSGQRDHPRSRGDGQTVPDGHAYFDGSPPLARGRPVAVRVGGAFDRITPARAGTAGPPQNWTRSLRDHPRSRGDGFYGGGSAGGMAGSPPLARGRHNGTTWVGVQPGITPARAGTASVRGWLSSVRRDHPRSRGDGPRTRLMLELAAGSPPLARGRRPARRPLRGSSGITPARAGTACKVCRPGHVRPDHPRSRGDGLRCQ